MRVAGVVTVAVVLIIMILSVSVAIVMIIVTDGGSSDVIMMASHVCVSTHMLSRTLMYVPTLPRQVLTIIPRRQKPRRVVPVAPVARLYGRRDNRRRGLSFFGLF